MINLLRAENSKLWRSKSFFICCLCAMGLSLMIAFSMKAMEQLYSPEMLQELDKLEETTSGNGIKFSISSDESGITMKSARTEEMLKQTFSGSIIQVPMAIFIAIFVACEYSCGAMKNIAAKGYSRIKIYMSKNIIVILGSEIIAILTVITLVGISGILWGFDGLTVSMWKDIGQFLAINLLLNASVASLFVMVTSLVRNIGGGIAINICVLSFFPLILGGIELIAKNKISISKYWIMDIITQASSFDIASNVIIKMIIAAVIYFIATCGIGMFFFQKRDI